MWHTDGSEVSTDFGNSQRNANEGADDDAVEESTAHTKFHQHGTQNDAQASQRGGGIEVTERNECGIIGYDDARVFQTNEGDEETNTRRNGEAQALRDAVHNLFAYIESCEHNEDESFDEDSSERLLPSVAHREAEGEGKEGIDAHTRSLCEGELCHEGNEECADARSQSGCREDSAFLHAGVCQNVGVHRKDVAHGEEGGETSQQLCAKVVFCRIKTYETIKELHTKCMVDE